MHLLFITGQVSLTDYECMHSRTPNSFRYLLGKRTIAGLRAFPFPDLYTWHRVPTFTMQCAKKIAEWQH